MYSTVVPRPTFLLSCLFQTNRKAIQAIILFFLLELTPTIQNSWHAGCETRKALLVKVASWVKSSNKLQKHKKLRKESSSISLTEAKRLWLSEQVTCRTAPLNLFDFCVIDVWPAVVLTLQVLGKELLAIRAACIRIEKKMQQKYRPSITLVVVQKRHHTRIFAADQRDEVGHLSNPPPPPQPPLHPLLLLTLYQPRGVCVQYTWITNSFFPH